MVIKSGKLWGQLKQCKLGSLWASGESLSPVNTDGIQAQNFFQKQDFNKAEIFN